MGHHVVGMEEYVAEGTRPTDRCIEDARTADLYIGMFGWRYGYVPTKPSLAGITLPAKTTAGKTSVTEFELRAAMAKKPLVFLLDQAANWPAQLIDAITGENEGGARIKRVREDLSRNFLAGFFSTPEDLARQVAAAVHRRELNDRIATLGPNLQAAQTDALMAGGPLRDSTLDQITRSLVALSNLKALRIDLKKGDYWWSTRLFFVTCMATSVTATELLIFLDRGDGFVGTATPAALRDRLARHSHLLREFDQICQRTPVDQQDIAKAVKTRADQWNKVFANQAEDKVRTLVRVRDLGRWLGTDLITQSVAQESDTRTSSYLGALLNWPYDIVPVTSGRKLKAVVDRRALAKYLADLFVKDLAVLARYGEP
jgi:hypothetical protein